jgi:U3 small nucleolar RNA-associated protein 7
MDRRHFISKKNKKLFNTDKKINGLLSHQERSVRSAIHLAARAETWLLPSECGLLESEGLDETIDQEEIVQGIGLGASELSLDLKLPGMGPYCLDLPADGSRLVIGGERGHFAEFRLRRLHLSLDTQVKEIIRDIKFLIPQRYVAVAQKKYTYIYDNQGTEIHCLKDHLSAHKLEFLPHHMLLASVGKGGVLSYQDVSTGLNVARHITYGGTCDVMCQNPWNAVLYLGHNNGTVSMWTPNINTPVVKMICHNGPIRSIASDPTGHFMVTTGIDCLVKLWDIRNLQPVQQLLTKNVIQCTDISQKGLLALAIANTVQIWKDPFTKNMQSPYMNHTLPRGLIRDVAFCPYEDIILVGHSEGISSIITPGSGEPNIDSYVANPLLKKKNKKESEFKKILDKLQPDTILLDPTAFGCVRNDSKKGKHAKLVPKANLACSTSTFRNLNQHASII